MKRHSYLLSYLFLSVILLNTLGLQYGCTNRKQHITPPVNKDTTIKKEDTIKKEEDTPIIIIKSTMFKLAKNPDNTYTILGLKEEYEDTTTQITIPVQIEGVDVSTIGQAAFQNAKFTKLTFESGSKVKTIKKSAFFNSALSGTVTFPASVETLEVGVVSLCKQLEKIMFEKNSHLKVIPQNAFWNVICQEIKLPNTIEKIEQWAFFNSKVRKVSFEDNSLLTSVEQQAFENSQIDTLIFQKALGKIGERAFWESKVKAIIFDPNSLHTIADEAFAYSEFERIVLPNSLKTIGVKIFSNCKNLKEVVLGNQMEKLSTYMFISCTSLNSITITNSIKTIEYGAFQGCSNLVTVNMDITNSQLNTIEPYVFHNCTNIKDISLPNNLNSIGENSFFNCVNLNSIRIGSNNALNIKKPFANIAKLDIYCEATKPPVVTNFLSTTTIVNINIFVPADKVNEYKNAQGWSQYAKNIKAN